MGRVPNPKHDKINDVVHFLKSKLKEISASWFLKHCLTDETLCAVCFRSTNDLMRCRDCEKNPKRFSPFLFWPFKSAI